MFSSEYSPGVSLMFKYYDFSHFINYELRKLT